MNIQIDQLTVRTRKTTEIIPFSDSVTFLYGPVGTGKSTIARLIDYCFGGELERTPAIQLEFLAVILDVTLGEFQCSFERGAEDTQSVRVTWENGEASESVNAPLSSTQERIIDAEVYNLSDLLFHLCGIEPIKVLKRSRDPDSQMIRLSFRDLWWYCYLDQAHLDSSFFRLDDAFRGRKSQDAMRFFTGLHSERLSQFQIDLYRAIEEQQGARQAVVQIRKFMEKFEFGSEMELTAQIEAVDKELKVSEEYKQTLESDRTSNIHPTDRLRIQLRELGRTIFDIKEAINVSELTLSEQNALRSELITAKIKAKRTSQASSILEGVEYSRCPQCGTNIHDRPIVHKSCQLCGEPSNKTAETSSEEDEALRREINDRIDQIADSIQRRKQALARSKRELRKFEHEKIALDHQLQLDLQRYDSAYIESIRSIDRKIATLNERHRSLIQLQEMPRAINELEEKAGAIQGQIDKIRSAIEDERKRLSGADQNAKAIAETFKDIMLDVGFPGVSKDDRVVLDPRKWKPTIIHSDQEWGFWDTGSGGKKTLFNTCYALAVHKVAREKGLPVPNILIIDSPTKNISEDENPELVQSLYKTIYQLASDEEGTTQFLLIDSEIVEPPEDSKTEFSSRRMAGEPDAPSLISYYTGP